MPHLLGPRRGVVIDLADAATPVDANLSAADAEHLIAFDEIYRGVCALLYNYVPRSGHPGGSISSGKIVAALLFDTMDYDLGDPDRFERRPHLIRGRTQGTRAVCNVGPAQRGRADRGAGTAAGV